MRVLADDQLVVLAVVLAHRDEPWLKDCIVSLLGSRDVRLRVALVDNGCSNPELLEMGSHPDVTLLRPGQNLGYAGGCNAGAALEECQVLAFVNSDCVVSSGAMAALARAALDWGGMATASVRLASQPELLNSAGNPVHFLGFSWAGELGEEATTASRARDVASVSGACFTVSQPLWIELGGFPEAFFAYHEDVELSLRCWLSGRPVRFEPSAVVYHHYEFSRNSEKMYLLERNRLLTLLTVLNARSLLLLLPGLLLAEFAVVVLAVRQGWLRQKLRGWLWLLCHRTWILNRRRLVQRQRRRSDRELIRVLTSQLPPGGPDQPARKVRLANMCLASYWRLVRRWL